jgi:Ohr subfamily peroxiredoxin
MQPLYSAKCSATQGREGHAKSSDGVINLPLAMPKELGGPGGAKTNPEQLFGAGYAACFGSALMMAARQKKVDVGECRVEATVHIGKEGASFGLAVELVGHFSKLKGKEADDLMKAAHELCPYSKATRNNIEVKLSTAA